MYTRAANHAGYTVDLYALALLWRHFLTSYLLMKIPISSHTYNLRNQTGFFLYFSAKYWKNFSFSLTGFTLSAYHVLHDFNISLWKGTNFKVAIIGCAILYVGTILSLSVSLSHPITLLRTCSYIQNGHSGHTAITITLILMTELLLWLCVINTLSFDCLCFNSLSQDQ